MRYFLPGKVEELESWWSKSIVDSQWTIADHYNLKYYFDI